jgi:TPP-dependent pyruvate/acetoin dehydrogenase alpha subunit
MIDTAKRKATLKQMILVLVFKEKLEELYQRKAMFGSTHSYRGQEAIAVGVCSELQSHKTVLGSQRAVTRFTVGVQMPTPNQSRRRGSL